MRYETHGYAGLGYPFTRGGVWALDDLIDKLPAKAESTAHPYWDADGEAKRIVDEAERFHMDPTVIMFGHSWGCKTLLESCWRLHAAGIQVAYVALIDPTALPPGSPPMIVPPNVQHVDHFLANPTNFLLRLFSFPYQARQRDPSGGDGGMAVNKFGVSWKDFDVPAGHTASARHEIVRKRVLAKVEEIIR